MTDKQPKVAVAAPGELYLPGGGENHAVYLRGQKLLEQFNMSRAERPEFRQELLRDLLGNIGQGTEIRPPLACDYGLNIHLGHRVYINVGAFLLDVAPIVIGDDTQLAPGVQVLTATHPIDPEQRRQKWETAEPVTIGQNVWLGAGAIVLPGVTIGHNTVVGAGAVVTKDLPANVLAVGNPARVIRTI